MTIVNLPNTLIRARAPLRLGLAGGGTDVSPYSDEFGGHVLNVTIDKYAYATLSRTGNDKVHLIAADTGTEWSGPATTSLPRISGLDLHIGVYNRVIKEFLQGKPLDVSITTHSEAPPGSGLGSSSTMVVAILKAFCEYLGLPLGEYEVARLAYDIERNDLSLAGGKQDQYAASFGGMNFMEFHRQGVIVNPLRLKYHLKAELESSLVLFYTGVSRESAKIIEQQTAQMLQKDEEQLQALHSIKKEASEMKEAILKGDWDAFAQSMKKGWEQKKKLAKNISNIQIDEIYETALKAGALAGKVSGAGGGGFMMFFVELAKRPAVIKCLRNFNGQIFTCNFVEHGAHSWRRN
jgi:D-glycero-alpha-D-manno-heptose-7-phosphate kinase